MSELVDPSKIEDIVGAKRHPIRHLARVVSSEERVYILHSQDCVDSESDLRRCPYSIALDKGINLDHWVQDEPVHVIFRYDDLVSCQMCELPYTE